jgi:mono/diheme cytochrome c family protein
MTQPRKWMMPICARAILRLAGLLAAVAFAGVPAHAQEIYAGRFPERTGEAIYKGICQGCHMPDAKGAVGAGAYPALANNRRLASAAYPALVVIKGQKAMPSFGDLLSDAQIAEVVNYVRSNFGNRYADGLTSEAVKALRPAPPAP